MATRDDDTARWVDDRLTAIEPPAGWAGDETRGLAQLRRRRSQRIGHRRRWMWLAVTAGVIAFLAIPTPHLRGFAQACGEFVLRGLPGSHSTDTYKQPNGRGVLADDSWRDLSGGPVRLSEYRGKVVLVTYWTTTCGQCASEMPWFNEFQRRYRERGFAVVGVSVDEGGAGRVAPFVTSRPFEYQVVLGEHSNGFAKSVPTTYIVDRDGRIAARHVGRCSKRELESDIETVLAEGSDTPREVP